MTLTLRTSACCSRLITDFVLWISNKKFKDADLSRTLSEQMSRMNQCQQRLSMYNYWLLLAHAVNNLCLETALRIGRVGVGSWNYYTKCCRLIYYNQLLIVESVDLMCYMNQTENTSITEPRKRHVRSMCIWKEVKTEN